MIDNCGGTLEMRAGTDGTLTLDLTEPGGQDEAWSLQATQQEYNVTTGGRLGDPINLMPDPMLPLACTAAEGGFTTSATVSDTPDMTHGFSYMATRTSPTALTCAGSGYWTDHAGATTPDPLNPVGKPDTAPALIGRNVAHAGTRVVTLKFDQEMLAATQGIPAVNRFSVTVDGVARSLLAVNVRDDSPPNRAVVALRLAGDVLPVGGDRDRRLSPAAVAGRPATTGHGRPGGAHLRSAHHHRVLTENVPDTRVGRWT